METKLHQLFDYQRFQNNARLAEIISDVENRYNCALEDNALELISAAGDPAMTHGNQPRLPEEFSYGKDDA